MLTGYQHLKQTNELEFSNLNINKILRMLTSAQFFNSMITVFFIFIITRLLGKIVLMAVRYSKSLSKMDGDQFKTFLERSECQ